MMLRACVMGVTAAFAICHSALAQDAQTPAFAWREIETENIFGFTEGTDIGVENEKEVSLQTIGRFGKTDGSYRAFDHRIAFGYTPTQFVHLELGFLAASHDIRNVTDLDNRNSTQFGGLSGELKYLLIGRGPGAPIGLAVSTEPEWGRVDETSGERVTKYGLENRLTADTALIEDRLFLALSGLYEPEVVKHSDGETERESTLGFSTALSYRFVQHALAGVEAQYFRHYTATGLHGFDGDAFYLGPTLVLQLAHETTLTAAWAFQVSGRTVGEPGSLNLTEYDRQRAKLKLNVEF
jgi:hypothetical protein